MALVTLLPLAVTACDNSEEMRLQREVTELRGQLADARQRSEDINVRMQQIRARNKVLIGLVEGLTAEPDKATDSPEAGVPSAHRALEALDHDIEVLATTLKQSREDMVEMRTQRKALQTNLNEAMRTIEDGKQREAAARERLDTYRGMLLRLRSMIESEELELQVVRNRMVVKLPEALLFETGQAKMKKDGREALAHLAQVLKSVEGREFEIAGHTDDVPIRTWRFRSNWDLAAARAVTVTRFLIEQGVPKERLSAAAYAATRPLSTEDTDEARAMNRRIEIVLLPKLDELPDLTALDGAAEPAPAEDDGGAAPAEAAREAGDPAGATAGDGTPSSAPEASVGGEVAAEAAASTAGEAIDEAPTAGESAPAPSRAQPDGTGDGASDEPHVTPPAKPAAPDEPRAPTTP